MKQFILFGILVVSLFQIIQSSDISHRISGGKNATRGQFPYQVAFVRRLAVRGQYVYSPFCGGSLIHPYFILTAAHCVHEKRDLNFSILGGVVTMMDPKKVVGQPSRLAVHEGYDKDRLYRNDIAIIKLQNPMFGAGVKTIELPRSGAEPRLGNYSIIAGFGRILPDVKSSFRSVLAFTNMTIMDPKLCYSPFFKSDLQICTRGVYSGRGTCAGDSGGALVDPGNHTILGLVSYGKGTCSTPTKRTVFTKVSAYIPWIKNQMRLL